MPRDRGQDRSSNYPRTRRRLVRGGLILLGGLGVASVGGVGAWALGINPLDYLPGASDTDQTVPQITRDLTRWNKDIRTRPANFNSVGQKVSEAAVGFYAVRMNEMFPGQLLVRPADIKPAVSFDSAPAYSISQNSNLD